MTEQDRWQRVERIFHEAIEREARERPGYLRQACGDDEALRLEVEELLRHHTRTGDLFDGHRALAEELIGGSAGDTDRAAGPSPHERDAEGRRVGPYRLEREIGRGGMGRVFLAAREDLPKRVALKLVREPLASPERVRRFELERRVLAGLDHPCIAQLLDAGITDDGSPWFAMEYVDGEMISTYCDRLRLTIEQRLNVVLGVCAAVRYAHANLVVHRDIKPSNIMVARDGRPKLLDFGVAKLLDTTAESEQTRTGLRAFTPDYAAPEQLRGGRVSTATDVYQLGGLLYELLTGRPPLDVPSGSPAEADRIVRELDPVPPSAAAVKERTRKQPESGLERLSAADLSSRRSTTPERLRRRLTGDLDTIVLKALAKEPERRYPSVEAFANDIERFLDGRPIEARPGTAAYRAKKFLLRHKAAAAVALLLAGYAVTVTLSATAIARERSRAEREAETATLVSDFLLDIFTRADPTDTVPGQATAAELVRRGADRVDAELAGRPEIQAAMQEVLGRVYHGMGVYDRAEPLLRTALVTRMDVFGPGSAEVASARHYLAQVLWSNGDLEGADSLNQQALEVRRRLFDDTDEKLWETLGNLGTVRQSQGRLEEAEQMVGDVVRMVRRAHPDGHPLLGGYLNNLANIQHARGDYASARQTMQEALDTDLRYLPAEHPDVALRLDNLAFMAYRAGDFEDAARKADDALAMYWRVYGAPHHDMPYAMATIADASLQLGDTVRADSMHLAALDLRRSLVGAGHQDLYRSYLDLGRHMFETGRAAEAEPHFREALRIARETRGDDHQWYGSALWNLGRVRERLDDPDAAEALMRQGYELHVNTLGQQHPTVADEREYLMEFLERSGRVEEARAFAVADADSTG